ncbi:MAG: ribbon-helix-helix domain-containing protein [PS1 clade bacterium]|uniref:Ribbon-helix-helix domain-containing protein n=1 Tax=PS1 clade bacterium TaxID=2175152 RepID=A0A937L6R6_9PROT|nr:ribbon-helix-helix domain-containing protein [PS1 clade bacterium]
MKPEKRSITIAGHATSVSLEPLFWDALKDMAAERGQSLPDLIRALDAQEREASLSSTLRVAVLRWTRHRN